LRHKNKIFQSTANSIALYADVCWGYLRSNSIESLQRYYLKTMFKLNTTTPNYMLAIETGLPDMYVTTFKHHCEFIVKLLSSSRDKLSKKIAQYAVRRKLTWFKRWYELATEINLELELNLDNPQSWSTVLNNFLNKLHTHLINTHRLQALSSTARVCYPHLKHLFEENSYFNNNFSVDKISTIFRVRVELLKLNYMPHRTDLSLICTICNLRESETVIHFVGKCPILAEIRRVYFEKSELNFAEICEILNGKNWNLLYQYCKEALTYRSCIVNEMF
jgi:hypothetical protein